MAVGWVSRLPGFSRPPRIYLHIGASKTGTTYLQGLMNSNRSALAKAGFLFPGEQWSEQARAVRDVFSKIENPRIKATTEGKWAKLREEMLAFEGKASIISMEYLSFADTERATRIIESLAGAEVHVILSVRDATSTIPGQWQTSCRNGGKVPYRNYVRAVRLSLRDEPPERPRRPYLIFQRAQGIPRMIDVWLPLVGAKRLHVVTVPPKGSDPYLLWRRFAKVIRVNPKVCQKTTSRSNQSLGQPSSELLRLVNHELGPVSAPDYFAIVRHHLARSILAPRAELEPPVRLNHRGLVLARRWNQRVRNAIVESGVRVVGNLDDLPVGAPEPGAPDDLPEPTAEQLLAAAATAREGLTELMEKLSAESGADVTNLTTDDTDDEGDGEEEFDEESLSSADSEGESSSTASDDLPPEVQAAVREVAELVRRCMELNSRLEQVSS